MEEFYISIQAPFGGFAPGYWENSLGSFGNKNQARAMTNIDMADPTGFKQGPGLSTLTNGTQAGAVATLIKHILPVPTSSDVSFAIGGNLLHQISSSAVTNTGNFPHTINKAAVTDEDGESCVVANGALYYFYNHSGSAGDIGKYDLSSTFDDDWGSTVPTGMAALQNAPHPSILGNDNVIYFGNGRYIGYYDPDTNTLSEDDFDTVQGGECVDVRYLNSRVWGAFNKPNIAGNNNSEAIIYVWGGVGFSSWEDFPNPRFYGKIGAIYPFGSRMFVWFQEVGYSGGYKLGYVNGNEIVEVAAFSGSLPNFGQVMEKDGMLVWVSNGLLHRWGSVDRNIPPVLSQHADGGFSTVGGIGAPFGTLMAASNQSTSYKLAQLSGLDTNSSWKSLFFNTGPAKVEKVRVHYTAPGSGARADLTLYRDQEVASLTLALEGQTGSITNTNDANTVFKEFTPMMDVRSEFSIGVDFSNGSTSNAITIRRIEIFGKHRDTK